MKFPHVFLMSEKHIPRALPTFGFSAAVARKTKTFNICLRGREPYGGDACGIPRGADLPLFFPSLSAPVPHVPPPRGLLLVPLPADERFLPFRSYVYVLLLLLLLSYYYNTETARRRAYANTRTPINASRASRKLCGDRRRVRACVRADSASSKVVWENLRRRRGGRQTGLALPPSVREPTDGFSQQKRVS